MTGPYSFVFFLSTEIMVVSELDLFDAPAQTRQSVGAVDMTQTVPGTLSPSQRGSGARRVFEALRDEILDLSLLPGAPIDEIQLAARFSLSRTPIREALVRLAGEGLVTTLPNRSTVVTAIDFLNLPQFFDALTLMYRVTTRLAARDHRPEDVLGIHAAQAAFSAAVEREDGLAMIATNRDFHLAIARAGKNPYYTALFGKLLDEGRRILRFYYFSFEDRLPRQYNDEHDAIIVAIKERDVEHADALAVVHADQIVTQIRQLIATDRRDHVIFVD